MGGTAPRWDTGEPFVYAPWAAGEPSSGNGITCTVTAGVAALRTLDAESALPYTCETEVWPTW